MPGKQYYNGRFSPKNPQKYKGNPTRIYWRSSWELQVMKWLDLHSGVTTWSSEEIVIPYRSPVDNKVHRYFPDFFVTIKNSSGIEENYIVEVKPKKQTTAPKKRYKKGVLSEAYVRDLKTYMVNKAKFEAAQEYCSKKGFKFMILTEDNLKKI